MNNDALKLNEKIKQIPEVNMYLKLKKEIENNQEIMNLYQEIHDMQLDLKKLASSNIEEYRLVQKELEKKKQKFMNHPIIVNYYRYREETLNIIEQLNQILK